jgi:hypothetical protein
MQFDKTQIIEMLQSNGDTATAAQADSQLPAQVDTDRDAGLLSSLGIDPHDLIAKFAGGSSGGLGGLLGS